ncbi:hypothetical protein [Paenibacillus nasutitermitis]|uniref:Uncharacterized protein n=1 Tax=Paenibacillus nasutitermitis TaxID=1652958 RepID=A0A916ZF68_9BACL|nr:hypothetical protein [Paenibacillus nasutitermitis]GGD93679.1 hypothetical protein GCM10010911_60420 [Paenibacillus nasutitermitis]
MDKNANEDKDLVTQRDIDKDAGLFTDEVPENVIQGAADELLEVYPYDAVLKADEDRVDEAEAKIDDSPVDPAAPQEEFHGTDLLNGVGNHPEEEALPE